MLLHFKCKSNLVVYGLLYHPAKLFITYSAFLIILQEFFNKTGGVNVKTALKICCSYNN